MSKKLFICRIHDDTIPPGIDPLWFRREFGRACRYLEKVTDEGVRILDSAAVSAVDRLKFSARQWLHVGFGDMEHAGDARIGEKRRRSDGAQSITFDSATKWATRWWHGWFTNRQDLYTIAVHELGHAFGLQHAPQDFGSVMAPNPANPEFSASEREQLLAFAAAPFPALSTSDLTIPI